MPIGYAPLPAFRVPGPLDFSGLNEGLDFAIQQHEKNRLLSEQKAIGSALFGGGNEQQNRLLSSSVPQMGPAPALPNTFMASPAQGAAAAAGREQPGSNPMDAYKRSIAGIESGGERDPYRAIGPVTRTGDRAHGKYQVMGANVGPWTQEVLGQEMTPEQFLASPEAQERVFEAKFGQYVSKTGNPQDAASMWFTGRPAAQGANRQASTPQGAKFGLTGSQYVDRFSSGLGGGNQNALLRQPGTSPAPQTSAGSDYDGAARLAAQQGNLELAMQLQNTKRQIENQTFERGRGEAADARAAETHGLTTEGLRGDIEDRASKRLGGIAQAISAEPDPTRKAAMWRSLLSVGGGKISQTLGQYGIDINDVDGGVKFLIAEAAGYRPPQPGQVPAGYRPVATDPSRLEFIPGGPADPATNNRQVKYTEVQSKAANFGNMMKQAEKDLTVFAGKDAAGNQKPLENPKNFLGATRDALVPFEGLANLMTPDATQTYKQLAAQWIRAKLRKESGAAIGSEEMEQEFRTYFPQYGDGPSTIAAKAKARAEATEGMIKESGGAYETMFVPTQPETSPSDGGNKDSVPNGGFKIIKVE